MNTYEKLPIIHHQIYGL